MTKQIDSLLKLIGVAHWFACSLKDVQSRTVNVNTDEDPSGWRPYYTFVENLREKYAKNEGLPGNTAVHFLYDWNLIFDILGVSL